jgi:hypothetical protein
MLITVLGLQSIPIKGGKTRHQTLDPRKRRGRGCCLQAGKYGID